MVEYEEVSDQVDDDVQDTVEDAVTGEIEEGQSTGDWIIDKLSYFAGLPVWLYATAYLRNHHLWPTATWKAVLLTIGLFMLVMLLVFLSLHIFKYMVLGFFFASLAILGFNSIKGNRYGFRQLGNDYKSLLYKAQGTEDVPPSEENNMQAQTAQFPELRKEYPQKNVTHIRLKKNIPKRKRIHFR